jgi:geranylgeranyl diphosphate synthase type I
MEARMLPAYFDPIRERIAATIRRFFQEKAEELARVNPLGRDAAERLVEFTLRGKMIRGCLVHLGWSIGSEGGAQESAFGGAQESAFGGAGNEGSAGARPDETDSVAAAGAAMELFQSGLLVHDDIMDRDLVRRGQPSIFQQYTELAGRQGHADPAHIGQALGICAGDVACFMAFELLARVRAPAVALGEVLALCARELSVVGIAQMQDVAWGASKDGVNVDDILRMYRYKTGRYSFSLPLLAGAHIAGARRDLREKLEAFGESLGLLFQIRDDELGLFGNEKQLGKPVGSDVREGKKTILISLLLEAAQPGERTRLDGILGNARASDEDLDFIRDLAATAGVRSRMDAITGRLAGQARDAIRSLTCGTPDDRIALQGLLDFTIARSQ